LSICIGIGKNISIFFCALKGQSIETIGQGLKKTREEMQTTLENRKKTITYFPRSVFKRKNKVEEGGTSSSRMKREHESTNLRAQKMMYHLYVVPTMVSVIKQFVIIP
jgi:DNA anti-recombination protein RmuC